MYFIWYDNLGEYLPTVNYYNLYCIGVVLHTNCKIINFSAGYAVTNDYGRP